MPQTFFEIALIWVAFILVYFTDHIKNIYDTLQPNFFSWQRWWAVMKGMFTKRTAFPFTVIILLTIAIIFINIWQTNDFTKTENQRNVDLIEAINNQTDAIIEAINNQTAITLEAIQQSGGQNGD